MKNTVYCLTDCGAQLLSEFKSKRFFDEVQGILLFHILIHIEICGVKLKKRRRGLKSIKVPQT